MDDSTDPAAERLRRKRERNREYMRRQRALGEEGTAYTAAKQRAWKAANPERVRAHRLRFKETNLDSLRAIQARDREKRREASSAYSAEYYALHADKRKAQIQAWAAANPEKVAELRQRRRARVKGSQVGPINVDALWTGYCGICREPIDSDLRRPNLMSRSIDHIVPLAHGGAHTQQNLQWTHLVCNLRKGSKVP